MDAWLKGDKRDWSDSTDRADKYIIHTFVNTARLLSLECYADLLREEE